MFTGQVSAFSITHRNLKIYRSLDTTSQLKLAVKIVRGDYKYVSRFFIEQLNARNHARSVVEKVAEELPRRLENTNIVPKSYDGYLALLNVSRDKIKGDGLPKDVSTSAMDRALREECWAATFGDHERPSGLFAARHAPQLSENNQDKWGSVRSSQIEAALTAANKLSGPSISGPELLRLVDDHFEVFSGPVWIHKEARVSLSEYLGLACAIHVLEMLMDKGEYTKEDARLLFSTLKEQNVPDTQMFEFSFSGAPEEAVSSKTASTSDLQSMIEVVHDRYFSGDINLYGDKRSQFDAKYNVARSAADKIEALKLGVTLLLEQTRLEKPRIVAMLDDLALLRRPIGNRESLVGDDD